MGAINLMMDAAIDAINDLGAGADSANDGYHFKADYSTRSADDITIKAGENEFVLAVVWKNLKGYEPSCPNLGHALRNSGNRVVRQEEYNFLLNANADLKQSLDWANEREADDFKTMAKMRSVIRALDDCLRGLAGKDGLTEKAKEALMQASEFID